MKSCTSDCKTTMNQTQMPWSILKLQQRLWASNHYCIHPLCNIENQQRTTKTSVSNSVPARWDSLLRHPWSHAWPSWPLQEKHCQWCWWVSGCFICWLQKNLNMCTSIRKTKKPHCLAKESHLRVLFTGERCTAGQSLDASLHRTTLGRWTKYFVPALFVFRFLVPPVLMFISVFNGISPCAVYYKISGQG